MGYRPSHVIVTAWNTLGVAMPRTIKATTEYNFD